MSTGSSAEAAARAAVGAPPDRGERSRIGMFDLWFKRANAWVLVAMMAAMVALVFGNVVARYAFNFSLIWAEELSQYLMVWVTFLGAGLALRQGRHVAVELVQDAAPAAIGRALRLVVLLLVAAFLIVLAVLGFQFVSFAWGQETPVLNISFGIPYLAVPIGAVLFLAHLALMRGDFVAKRFEAAESLEAAAE
jgi:TRAP-type C4-dicarboxylate transport system permease small subunit